MRLVVLILAVLFALAPGPGQAWAAGAPNAAAALGGASKQAADNATAPASLSAADLQKLVATLQNPQQRELLVKQLQALIAAQTVLDPAAGTATPGAAAAKPAATGSTPADKTPAAPTVAAGSAAAAVPALVEGLATQFQSIGAELVDVAGIARGAPRLMRLARAQAASPEARARWLDGLLRLAAVVAAAMAAGFITGWALRGLRRRVGARNVDRDVGRWLVLFLGMLILELVPLGVFTAVAMLVLAAVHPGTPARPVAAIAIATILHAQLILIALRVLLVSAVAPRFLRFSHETRQYLYLWARRFVVWSFYGFGVAAIAAALAAPHSISDLVMRLTVIIVAGLAIVFVLQNRAAVASYLRAPPAQPSRFGRTGQSVRMIRAALADTWHILAIVYIVVAFGAYLIDPRSGVGFVLRATLISILVLLGAFVATRLVHRAAAGGFRFGHDFRAYHPGLERRLNKYVPGLIFILSVVIDIVAIILLLQVWGVDAVEWLERQYVRSITGSLISIVIIVVLAIVVWEMVNAAVERALSGGNAAQQAQVSARLRTLLPLIRTTVLIAIVTIAGLVVLSQVGVNIAPLLAGAGIVGIAVGFGSQQLVHDIINGLFILIENTVTIGDWVDVGGGHAGSVETISIRSMRLRDGNGAVHTVPYSAVAAITNTNRGIGNATFAVAVAYGEDTDKVARILAEIAAAMRQEPAFKAGMLSEFQLWGVDKVDAATATVSGQIVCTDAARWPVQRAFNRRMMLRFQEEGIALAVPLQGIVVREPPLASDAAAPVTPLRAPRDRG